MLQPILVHFDVFFHPVFEYNRGWQLGLCFHWVGSLSDVIQLASELSLPHVDRLDVFKPILLLKDIVEIVIGVDVLLRLREGCQDDL